LTNCFFKPTFTLCQDKYIWLESQKDEKPQVHFKTPLIKNILKCNISSTCNLFKGYKIDCELYLNFHEFA
jgi:hypothetical protein